MDGLGIGSESIKAVLGSTRVFEWNLRVYLEAEQ